MVYGIFSNVRGINVELCGNVAESRGMLAKVRGIISILHGIIAIVRGIGPRSREFLMTYKKPLPLMFRQRPRSIYYEILERR